MESEIQLKESGICLTIGIQNPSSTDMDPESTARSPEPKTVFNDLTGGGGGRLNYPE